MNRFAECGSIDQVIRQAVGAGSRCWEHLDRAGVFDTEEAIKISNEAFERILDLFEVNGV